jgi:methyl-accepting chemotaxis protein
VAEATKDTSKGAMEAQKAAVELSDMADQLKNIVNDFNM